MNAKEGAFTETDRETLNGIRAKMVSTEAFLAMDLTTFDQDFGECQAHHVQKGETDLATSQKAVEKVQQLIAQIKASINGLAVALGSMQAIRDADLRFGLSSLLEGLNETLGMPLNFGHFSELHQLGTLQQDKEDISLTLNLDDMAWKQVVEDVSIGAGLDIKTGKVLGIEGMKKKLKKDEESAAKLDLNLRYASAKDYLDNAYPGATMKDKFNYYTVEQLN